jgi:hypothetical protein
MYNRHIALFAYFCPALDLQGLLGQTPGTDDDFGCTISNFFVGAEGTTQVSREGDIHSKIDRNGTVCKTPFIYLKRER